MVMTRQDDDDDYVVLPFCMCFISKETFPYIYIYIYIEIFCNVITTWLGQRIRRNLVVTVK